MKLITYPARPVNGGPLPKARPKPGLWFYEPKYNGWRTIVHAPSGTMFNRHGQALTINAEFATALAALRYLRLEWLDCEALERRHAIGRGSLIVLDYIPVTDPKSTYGQRREFLERDGCAIPHLGPHDLVPDNTIRLSTRLAPVYAPKLWDDLQSANKVLGCDFYEGLVAKRADSLYPLQLRNSSEEFPGWMKHRWAF